MIQLDNRLQQIADMVPQGARVADIGTDHGYLIAHLVERGIVPYGYACDINRKPLEKAASVVAQLGLQGQIECLLTDGLQGLDPEAVDVIVIAGMGGDLIERILENAPWVRDGRYHLLLQPMTKPDHLRAYLAARGFDTRCEQAVASGRFVYTVFSVVYDGIPRTLTEAERYIGKVLEGASPDTALYLQRVRNNLCARLEGLARAAAPDEEERRRYHEVLTEVDARLAQWKETER